MSVFYRFFFTIWEESRSSITHTPNVLCNADIKCQGIFGLGAMKVLGIDFIATGSLLHVLIELLMVLAGKT